MQFSLRARYGWSIGDHEAFAQVGTSHTAHSFTQAGSNPTFAGSSSIGTSRLRFENAAYSTWSASVGIAKNAWTVTLFGENLSNSNAATFTSTDQFIVEQTPLRPRVLGLSFDYKTQ
jgi:iron complex outermembrane recepter protein